MNVREIPHTQAAAWPETKPGGIGEALARRPPHEWLAIRKEPSLLAAGGKFHGLALLGLADDEGVRLNGGRLGARDGPDAVRAALARYGRNDCAAWAEGDVIVVDAGNVVPGRELVETHNRVTEAAGFLLDQQWLPVGVGGGHDLTFPLVRAVAQRHARPLNGIYFDAHLDVRPELGSGMPFRRLVEDCNACLRYCIGLDPFVNSNEHWQWFRQQGGDTQGFDAAAWPDFPRQFVSVDLDVLDAAYAPGVSAANPGGLSPREVACYVEAAGRCAEVCCFDIMELCPTHDVDGRTARLAAHLLLRFIKGCSTRSGPTISPGETLR